MTKTIYNGRAVHYGTSGYFEYETPVERPESTLQVFLTLLSVAVVATALYIVVGA